MLNELGPRLREALPGSVRMRHQTGPREHASVDESYRRAGLDAEVVPYIRDMAAELADTDLAVCRAGAMTVAELAASGTAALLVPFARATGDHQALNARAHAEAGAAWCLEEHALSAAAAAAKVREAMDAASPLGSMDARARARAIPGAAERIVDRLLELLGER
ncbi:MAG: glycosyltransferase [Acidobacteriota bacterium]